MRAVTVLICACLSAALALGCAPAALTQDQIVPAFIAASQAGTRTMHVEWHGTMNQVSGGDQGSGLGQISQSFDAAFDFSGPDYAGGITTAVAGIGQSNQISYARVGGNSFVNLANSGWQNAGNTELDPLRGLTETGVGYEALDTLDGQQVQRLRVADPLAALDGALFPTGSFGSVSVLPGGKSDYLVYVDANGIPVAAHMAIDLAMTPPEGGPTISGLSYSLSFDYTFSLWGEPVTISPPNVTNGGGIDFPPQPRVQTSNQARSSRSRSARSADVPSSSWRKKT